MCNEKENLMERRMMILDSSKIVSIIGTLQSYSHTYTLIWKEEMEKWILFFTIWRMALTKTCTLELHCVYIMNNLGRRTLSANMGSSKWPKPCVFHMCLRKKKTKVFITLVNSNEEENVISPNNGALESLQVILQMGKHSKTVKSHPLHRSL